MRFKKGDIIRYGTGSTALMKITADYSGNYKSNTHGFRFYGIQFFGSIMGCYEIDARLGSKNDVELFNDKGSKRV